MQLELTTSSTKVTPPPHTRKSLNADLMVGKAGDEGDCDAIWRDRGDNKTEGAHFKKTASLDDRTFLRTLFLQKKAKVKKSKR